MAKKNNKRDNRRLKKLIAICVICAVVLVVSTYAWFIGMKTVSVNEFEIEIATTEGLFLSMDGQKWSYKLDVKSATAYDKNANVWADDGLIPMSTVGDMDSEASRMKLFEKGSLTTTPGGYRLLTSRVNNYNNVGTSGQQEEGKGYVAFDLFIKNLSGTEYYTENNPLNEEAIYLTTNSAVKVSENGGVDKTGIENSVRVAFAQIGRVEGTSTDQAEITGITCKTEKNVTGICRNAQIWEPNDKAHVQNAISWYNTSCKKRTGATVTDAGSYGEKGSCATIADKTAYPTYAVSKAIAIADQVDVYDGKEYNTYETNSIDYATYDAAEAGPDGKDQYKLVNFPYFTDTMKAKVGMERPAFMTLAPNSITKVRVYIYIEGQDIDNYDFAQLGKKISVNFGFTKERFETSDVEGYNGPAPVEGVDAES